MRFNKSHLFRARGLSFAFFFVLCALGAAGYEQSQHAEGERHAVLSGTLFDVGEAVITRAEVTLTNGGTKEAHTTQSDDEGRFVFEGLQTGDYDLQVEAHGFKIHRRSNIYLQRGDRQHFNLTLEVLVIRCVETTPSEPLETVAPQIVTSLSSRYPPPAMWKQKKASQRKPEKR
ncbi:MAG TPA: carboxypeptidase-like regulatory domain-containing protein [Pyrinomonadaceae bacterium]|nr:carboxypeptidase-like regulatory domain-containing protein [Pyrinomonadaceae bacterium]